MNLYTIIPIAVITYLLAGIESELQLLVLTEYEPYLLWGFSYFCQSSHAHYVIDLPNLKVESLQTSKAVS